MMTCRTIVLTALMLVCSLPLRGEQYKYVKGHNIFEVAETATKYEVVCRRSNSAMTSRNKNILDRQFRLDAIDLIGAYILFKREANIPASLFQIYVDGINLHYTAYVEGVRQEEKTIGGTSCIVYSCAKENYRIAMATYNTNINIPTLLAAHYARNKGENAAAMIYDYEGFSSEQYLMLERDFLLGAAMLPQGVRSLHEVADRFEMSVYSLDDAALNELLKPLTKAAPKSKPYAQFFYEEMVTASPLSAKAAAYKQWRASISSPRCVWEDFLLFCSNKANAAPKASDASFSEIIAAYPGAVSPFGVRQPTDDDLYHAAAQAYSQSNFETAVKILKESVDNEGISARTLNLLGASYRFLGQEDKAIPFLLLGFKLEPKSAYVTGNIALCAQKMGYPRLRELCSFLLNAAADDWSSSEIKKLRTMD